MVKIAVHLINLAVMEHVVKVGNTVLMEPVNIVKARCATERAVAGIKAVKTVNVSVMMAKKLFMVCVVLKIRVLLKSKDPAVSICVVRLVKVLMTGREPECVVMVL